MSRTRTRMTAGWGTAVLLGICLACPLPAEGPTATTEPPPVVRIRFEAPVPMPAQSPIPVQLPMPAQLPDPLPEQPPQPSPVEALPNVYPIDLITALRLAQANNLDILQAREVIARARAGFDRARVMLIPSLNIGSTYVDHQGNIQRTEGSIIKVNRDSLFVGLGPSLSVSFADALFAPLVARQLEWASEAGWQRVHNDTLLLVADAYLAVLRARRRLARVEATLDFLSSDKPSPARADSKGLLPIVQDHLKVGAQEGLKAEVERVRVEILRRQEEREGILQEMRVATAELARLLRLDPQMPLWPMEDFRFPMDISGPWLEQPPEELVRLALDNRPELAENEALVRAAVNRVRNAFWRPWAPTFIVNYSWGDFGGAPDPNPAGTKPAFGQSGRILHFGTRADWDASLVWRFQNMGLGNLAELREQKALARQTGLRQLQVQDQVVTQVVQAYELVNGWRERVDTTRSSLFDNAGKPTGPVFQAIRLTFDRVKNDNKARPLETLDSVRGLNDMLEAYGQAVTDYERARFRMLIVLGLPAADILEQLAWMRHNIGAPPE